MICKYCGRDNKKDSNFCDFCGRPLDNDDKIYNSQEFEDYDYEQDDYYKYREEYNKNNGINNNLIQKLIILVSCIIVILVGAIVILGFNSSERDKTTVTVSSSDKSSNAENQQQEENQVSNEETLKNQQVIDSSQYSEKNNSSIENQNKIRKQLNNLYISDSKCSSILHDSTNKDYSSTRVLDGDFSTVWSEGVSGYGQGEWLRLDLDNIYTIKKIKIVNGLINKKNGYYNNNRVKSLTLKFSDGSNQKVYLEDHNTGYQVVDIEPVESSYIKFVIDHVYYGSKYDDTCIADIEILGY